MFRTYTLWDTSVRQHLGWTYLFAFSKLLVPYKYLIICTSFPTGSRINASVIIKCYRRHHNIILPMFILRGGPRQKWILIITSNHCLVNWSNAYNFALRLFASLLALIIFCMLEERLDVIKYIVDTTSSSKNILVSLDCFYEWVGRYTPYSYSMAIIRQLQ